MDEAAAIKILESYKGFIEHRKLKLVLLLGVAYDTIQSQYDRRRFKSVVSYFLQQKPIQLSEEEEEETGERYEGVLFICIDPNFTEQNIKETLNTLNEIENIDFRITKAATYNDDPPTLRLSIDIHNDDGYEVNNYFLFLKYPLTSAYSLSLGNKIANEIAIQEGTKTIDTYREIEECKVKDGTIYKAIQELALMNNIREVYFASTANAHRRDFLQIKDKKYKPKRITKEFGEVSNWWIENRYLEDFCEIHSVMKNIYETGKPVFFIQLDRKFPTFYHPSIQYNNNLLQYPNIHHPSMKALKTITGLSNSNSDKIYFHERFWLPRSKYNEDTETFPPIIIPINEHTTLERDPLFQEVKGGKRKNITRKRKTRKQKSKDTKRN